MSAMAPSHSSLKRPAAASPKRPATPKRPKPSEVVVEEDKQVKTEMVSPDPKANQVARAGKAKAAKPQEYPKIPQEEAKKNGLQTESFVCKRGPKAEGCLCSLSHSATEAAVLL